MIKLIKRKIDNKYLQSVETDNWVENIKDALEMTYRECENVKNILEKSISKDDYFEVYNFTKIKSLSKEEKQELYNLLKNTK